MELESEHLNHCSHIHWDVFPPFQFILKKKHHCWEWEDLHIFATKNPPGTRASPVARRRRNGSIWVFKEMSFCCSKNLTSLEGCFEKKKT